jgi:dipeptidyl-peptidase-4
MERTDNRKVKDLWVINALSDPRPTLETYKYWMPGEKEAPVDHVYLFDMVAMTNKEMTLSAVQGPGYFFMGRTCKDQYA